MDLQKILSGVKSLNDYIAATEKVVSKSTNIKLHLNMSTVLNLKKVRSLEIEYFNKCEEFGAAFVLFERMLMQPPSKTWALLGKELTATILYWLDAVRKHLITHCPRWWSFLETVLKFIREMKSKDPSLPGTIVEQTTECLLDLSCNGQLDELQRHVILHTVNECSAESSRELRLKMKEKLSGYFTKLSQILPTCGHFPTQLGILEALLRWLVGRCDPQVRAAAARAWFPRPLYRETAVELFLERTWADFFQNAREFLNLQNAGCPDRVLSTVCKKLTFDGKDLINGPQARPTWLDVNAASRTVTVALDPRALEPSADCNHFDTIVVSEENTLSVQLYRSSSDIMLSLHTLSPLLLAALSARALAAAVSSRRLPALDRALRAVFAHKYRVLLNVDDVSTSPEAKQSEPPNRQVRSADEIRRSNIPVRRRKQSGFVVRSRNPLQFNSPSSTSTTSLAQLHERLAALPPIYYNKEPVKVCAQPELSMVREVSEGDEHSFSQSSGTKSKHFGSCHAAFTICSKDRTFSKETDAPPATETKDKPLSSMLIATLGSADETFVNDAIQKITANNTEYDLVDLIVKEALQNGPDKDSGITSDRKTQDSEVIENTPAEKQVKKKKLSRTRKAKCTIVSTSTTDESNTEPVLEVTEPCFVTDRKKRLKSKDNSHSISEESKSFDAAAVDVFFSQHYTENAAGCIVISPTLARRLNETPSEGSQCNQNDMDEELIKNDLTFEVDIIDCLNSIVDKVCNLEKCVESLSKQQKQIDVSEIVQNVGQDPNKNFIMNEPKTGDKLKSNDGAKVISLKYPQTKKRAPKKKTKQTNVTKDKKADKNPNNEDNIFIEDTDTHSPVNKPNTSLIRKKRKLYSPKDDEQNEDDIPIAKLQSRLSTGTPIATCYKELEIARRARSRIPRKLRTSSTDTSPKAKKLNDMFDKLKETVENEETITLVKRKSNKRDSTVYNYTSESEDEDFKKKKTNLQKRVSRTSLESTAKKRGRPVSRINYSEGNHNSSSDETKKTTKKRKVVRQTKPRSRKVTVAKSIDLTDERMREAPPEVLETSFVKEASVEKKYVVPEPTLAQAPEVEMILEENIDAPIAMPVPESKSQKKKKTEILQVKKEKEPSKNVKKNTEILAIKKEKGTNKKVMTEKIVKRTDSGSESSLPGLVVESEQPRKDVMSSSVEANLMQKFKKIYTEGPDVDDSDATQKLLLRTDKAENLHEGNKDEKLDMCEDNFTDNPMNEDLENNFEVIDLNQNTVNPKENAKPMVLSESPSEKTIETGGKSPITGHNDLDESPPNMAMLLEKFQDRDLEIQDMDQSMADFFVQLRCAVQFPEPFTSVVDEETTSEFPLTKMSSKEQAVTSESSPREQMTSQKSSAKDKVSTLKSSLRTLKVVLPVDEIEKYVSPVKSQKSFVSMSSASVVLQRISSDEINKWLPMPRANSEYSEENVKKHDTRLASKKPKLITRKRKEGKLKAQKIRPTISPIMLSFDVTGNEIDCDSSADENINVENLPTTRSKAKRLKNLQSQQTNREEKEQDIEIVEKITTQESSSGNRMPEPVLQPPAKYEEINEFGSESAKTIASINEWFKRNLASSQYSSTKDNINQAMKDMIGKMMETLETTLTEIHQSTGKKLASMFVDNQKRLSCLEQELRATDERINSEVIAGVTRLMAEKSVERDLRFRQMIAEFQKEQKERACEVIVEDRKQKILMVALLKEDLEAVLDFIERQNN